MTRIKNYAFDSCTGLSNITLPSNVAYIGTQAFYNCSNLKVVLCKSTTIPTIGGGEFCGCSNDLKIYVPSELIDSYKSADEWKDYADYIFAS